MVLKAPKALHVPPFRPKNEDWILQSWGDLDTTPHVIIDPLNWVYRNFGGTAGRIRGLYGEYVRQ